MQELQLNMAAQQTAELLLMRLRDPETDTKTAIEAHIQQMRLIVEPPKIITQYPREPIMKIARD